MFLGFPGSSDGKESACSVGDLGLIPGMGRSPAGGSGNTLLPGEPHGQRSLVGYSPWGRRESDLTEATDHACTQLTLEKKILLLRVTVIFQFYELIDSSFIYPFLHFQAYVLSTHWLGCRPMTRY